MKTPCVYILASKKHGTLYVGETSGLSARVWQHKEKLIDGFTTRHEINRLVYYERHETMYNAITREKQIKKWKRAWKVRIIEEMNPSWDDLYESIL